MAEKNIKEKTILGLVWTFFEKIASQLISIVISVVLARLIIPESFGVVAIIAALVNFLDVIVTCALNNALIQKEEADTIDFSSALWFSVFFGFIIYIVLFLLSPVIADYYSVPVIKPALRILGIQLLLTGFNTIQHAYIAKSMQFRYFFFSTVFATVVSGVASVFIALKGYGVWALVAQILLNYITDILVLQIIVRWKPRFEFSGQRLKALLKFSIPIACTDVLDRLQSSFQTLVLGKRYKTEELSYYEKGAQYPNVISSNINNTVNTVLFSAFSNIGQDREEAKNILKRSIMTSSFTIAPMLVGFALVAEEFVRLLLTDVWLPAVPYIQLLSISLILIPMGRSNEEVIKAFGYSNLRLKQELIKKTIAIALIFASSRVSMTAVAICSIAISVINYVVDVIPCGKLLDYSISNQFADMLPNFVLTAFMAAVVYFCGKLEVVYWLKLIIKVSVGIFTYIIAACIFRNKSLLYCVSVFNDRLGKSNQVDQL